MSLLAPEELLPLLDDDGGPCHGTCCDDDYLALCGRELVTDDFEPNETPMTCAACIEVDERNLCPKYGKCPK